MATMNAAPAAKALPEQTAIYAEFPYPARLALACEESEDFMLSDAFLEAIDAEVEMSSRGLRRR